MAVFGATTTPGVKDEDEVTVRTVYACRSPPTLTVGTIILLSVITSA